MSNRHPFVSERREGRPWFEWTVAAVTAASALIAFLGCTMAATVMLAVAAIGSGAIRIVLKDASPWKVRSCAFDAACGIGIGVLLLMLYVGILLLDH
ncbi:hypothetical protein [Bifidobacterium cuniculi]|uniref:Rod shape-determining protein RodA n=1 Tax=Bifidobacterium cuniculi TaxID=1688 RepID=A0A087AW16_9BIFI|nr:hypothetical protein [Bifidobacterium cuniculi]KFI62966.1 hypothetical protein BCUN_0799 [Bifidobacterium cuniculi]